MVFAVVIGIIGLFMFLRSGWVLKQTEFFADKQFHSTWLTLLRSTVFSETVIELIVGLAGIGAAIYLLYLNMPSQPALFMLVGWLSAAALPFVWWYGVRGYAGLHGECAALFDPSLPVHVFQPDFLADCAHYFKYLSGFSAVWLGVTAGGRVCNLLAPLRGILLETNRVSSRISFGSICWVGRCNIVLGSG
jgi:hypothetical protein